MKISVGKTLTSAVDGATVIVIKASSDDVDLTSGGLPLYDPASGQAVTDEPDASLLSGTELGKRYVDADETIEVLATSPGRGTLAMNGRPLVIKAAKSLPASD